MKKSRVGFLTALSVLALLASCGGGKTNKPDAASIEAADRKADAANQGFANTAAAAEAFDIAAGHLAQELALSETLREFGGVLVDEHSASQQALEQAAARARVPFKLDARLSPEQEAQLNQLRGLGGAAFDAAFKKIEIASHEKRFAAINAYALDGGDTELKSWANRTSPIVQAHLERLRAL